MTKDKKTVWKECLKIIKDIFGPSQVYAYETWFEPIIPESLVGNVLTLRVPSQYYYDYLEANYVDVLRKAIREVLGPKSMLQYIVVMDQSISSAPITTQLPSNGPQQTANKPKNIPIDINKEGDLSFPNPFIIPGLRKLKIESQLNPSYNLDNFVEGSCNRLARAAGYAVAKNPGRTSFNPLLIHGGVGLGKTHLAHAIGIKTKELHPDLAVLYVNSEQFMQQYASAGKNNTTQDFVHFYQMVDVLILDDIQIWDAKAPGTQNAFFQIFNDMHLKNKQIIITSDKAPSELQGLEARLISRLKWGLAADLQMPDAETRMAILKQKLANDGVVMTDDVIEYIAYNINTNVRELEGALVSLMAQSTLNKKQITLELAQQMVDKFVKSTTREITIDVIQKTVCDSLGVPVDSILSKTRKREIVQARQITMYFAKKLTNASLAVIGQQCGNKDHATVLHACKTIANLDESDKKFHNWMNEMEKKFKE
ncbi:MAG: chromosomal replication initiator protein DnaA [Bacteroidales bacterium]|nr:chromosomal replication initiator protein DnaA [Bacteroidales bacterium]